MAFVKNSGTIGTEVVPAATTSAFATVSSRKRKPSASRTHNWSNGPGRFTRSPSCLSRKDRAQHSASPRPTPPTASYISGLRSKEGKVRPNHRPRGARCGERNGVAPLLFIEQMHPGNDLRRQDLVGAQPRRLACRTVGFLGGAAQRGVEVPGSRTVRS